MMKKVVRIHLFIGLYAEWQSTEAIEIEGTLEEVVKAMNLASSRGMKFFPIRRLNSHNEEYINIDKIVAVNECCI